MTEPTPLGPELIDLDRARFYINKAIEEKGADYMYHPPVAAGSCVYFDPTTEQPSCIVGQVLSYVGVTKGDLPSVLSVRSRIPNDLNATGFATNETDLFDALSSHAKFTLDAIHFLGCVQTHQDQSVPWGKSVQYAEGLIAIEGAS